MRKMTWSLLLLAMLINLAACGQSVAAPTTAPTAVPVGRPTQAPVSNPAGGGADLGSAAWKWTQGVTAVGAPMSVPDTGKFRLQFDPSAGRVGIATACNSATGTYTTDGHALKIMLESITNAVCPGDKLSPQFIAELGGVVSYTLDQGNLVLQVGGGGGTLTLTH